MNVKQGDIARIVKSHFSNLDKLVLVLEASPGNGLPIGSVFQVAGRNFKVDHPEFCWVVESLGAPLKKNSKKKYRICPVGDSYLRPIRDPGDDATDETLAWKSVPTASPARTKETA